jgi:ankyrin repeat protein
LRCADHRTSKRNVQEKLNLLLQPKPNKIRPKGDTKVLRKLLLKCKHLQKSRRLRKQHRRYQDEHQGHGQGECGVQNELQEFNGEEGVCSIADIPVQGSSFDISNCHSLPLEPVGQNQNILGAATPEMEAPASSFVEDRHGSCVASTAALAYDFSPLLPFDSGSEPSNSLPELAIQRPESQPELVDIAHLGQDSTNQSMYDSGEVIVFYNDLDFGTSYPDLGFGSEFGPRSDFSFPDATSPHQHLSQPKDSTNQSMYDSGEVIDFYNDLDFGTSYPDLGFGSEFGPRSDFSFPDATSTPPTPLPADSWTAASEGVLFHTGPRSNEPTASSLSNPLPPSRIPMVNPTYIQNHADSNWWFEFDAPNLKEFEVLPFQVDTPGFPNQDTYSPNEHSLPNQDCISSAECLGPSKHSPSTSNISTLFSKMSISLRSIPHAGDRRKSDSHSSVQFFDASSLVKLPGVFPEYCWYYINQNQLRGCDQRNELQNCSAQCYSRMSPTSRTIDTDILSRIAQRSVQEADLHEMDTFGNSTIHILATMCATPSYLISLIKLGANVNVLNRAGQTFLHLLKPELLCHCDDFCYLLELLRVQGFDFLQHDHLGQSPFHLLMRPSHDQAILRQIITRMDDLPIHRHISTARDCFGNTVVGQLNFHGTESGFKLDHAILSLSCETDNAIFDSKGLQISVAQGSQKEKNSIEEEPARNYENHPSIVNVNDLFLYEQHVDYWRTILTAKNSPWFEDSNGRNGLHCLAEASLVTAEMPLPATLLKQLESLKDMGDGDRTSDRGYFVKSLLNVGVDPNNYDNVGNTPFMAFIVHHHVSETDDSITQILSCLLEAGSDIHRRNRHGETALHLAVKLGRRAATKFLLASGANIHARTSNGLGVLQLGHNHSMLCMQDESLFAQIMLCMSLAVTCGAVAEPTILDEWGTPGLRVVAQKIVEPRGFKLVKKFLGIRVKGRRQGKASGKSSK